MSCGRSSNWILIKWRKTIFYVFKLYLFRPYFLRLLHLRYLSSSVLTNSMEYGPLEASSLPSGEEIRLVLWSPKAPYRARFVSHDFASEGFDFLDRDAAARGVSKERSAFTCKGQEVTEGSSQAAATCSDRARSLCTLYLCLMVMLSADVRVVRFLSRNCGWFCHIPHITRPVHLAPRSLITRIILDASYGVERVVLNNKQDAANGGYRLL